LPSESKGDFVTFLRDVEVADHDEVRILAAFRGQTMWSTSIVMLGQNSYHRCQTGLLPVALGRDASTFKVYQTVEVETGTALSTISRANGTNVVETEQVVYLLWHASYNRIFPPYPTPPYPYILPVDETDVQVNGAG
jgi:hypothetical protein